MFTDSGDFSSFSFSFGAILVDLFGDKSILPKTEGLEIVSALATIFSTSFFDSSFLIEIIFFLVGL